MAIDLNSRNRKIHSSFSNGYGCRSRLGIPFRSRYVTTDECRLEQEETRASCQTKASISTELDPSTGVLDEYVCVIEDETASLGSLTDTDRINVIELDCLNHSGDSSGCETYSQDGGIRVISPVQSDLFNLQVLVLQNQLAFESEADSGAEESASENLDPVQEDGSGDRVSRIRLSNSVKEKIAIHRTRFFHSLPLEKQIILLRRSEDLRQQSEYPTHACMGFARQLCDELKLNYQSVYSWLVRRCRFFKNSGNSLSPKHMRYLTDEFKLSSVLSDDRALLLGYVLQAPVSAIRRWFELKRNGRLKPYRSFKRDTSKSESNFEIIEDGMSEEEPDSPSKTLIDDPASDPSVNVSNNGVVQVRKTKPKPPSHAAVSRSARFPFKEYQLEILFQAFKRCPNLTSSRAEKISLRSDIPKEKIYTWFRRMRVSLAKLSSSVLLSSYRNQDLTPEQVQVLECEYEKRSYINEPQLNSLADQLEVEKCLIKKWFLSRRCYDIAFSSKSSSDEDDEVGPSTPSLPIINLGAATDDDTARAGSSSVRSEGSHFSGVFEAENFLFNDEGHDESVESSSKCCTQDVFEFEDNKEPIISVGQWRKNSVESVASNSSSSVTSVSTESPPKKKTSSLTPFQRIVLRKEYRKSAYITPGEAQQLAVNLRLPVKRVRVWFERMRLREKNQGTSGPRMRWPLVEWQKRILQEEYEQNPTLTKNRLELLCDKLKVSHPTIMCWFREQKATKK